MGRVFPGESNQQGEKKPKEANTRGSPAKQLNQITLQRKPQTEKVSHTGLPTIFLGPYF